MSNEAKNDKASEEKLEIGNTLPKTTVYRVKKLPRKYTLLM